MITIMTGEHAVSTVCQTTYPSLHLGSACGCTICGVKQGIQLLLCEWRYNNAVTHRWLKPWSGVCVHCKFCGCARVEKYHLLTCVRTLIVGINYM